MSEEMTVVTKLVKATQELGSFAADKHNQQGHYDYISADLVLGRIGKVMASNGIMVIPAITRAEHYEGQTGKGTKNYICNIEFCMKITDGDSAIDMFWVGSGVDYGSPDKALYKAITSGHKYFLMKLFCVGIGNEDGEHESTEAQPAQAPQKRQGPKRAQPQNGNGALPTATADETFGDGQRGDVKQDTLAQLHAAGLELYQDDWETKCADLVEKVSTGATRDSERLMEAEAQKLLKGISKKLSEQKQTA